MWGEIGMSGLSENLTLSDTTRAAQCGDEDRA